LKGKNPTAAMKKNCGCKRLGGPTGDTGPPQLNPLNAKVKARQQGNFRRVTRQLKGGAPRKEKVTRARGF